MRGGGFLILLFLFICFICGVNSVVGGIRKFFQSNTTPEKTKKFSDNQRFWRLKEIIQLHQNGILGDEDFQKIKAQILQSNHINSVSENPSGWGQFERIAALFFSGILKIILLSFIVIFILLFLAHLLLL
jgi:hypothetical protein